ncbi:hypothetical protein IFM89_039338 [Coptis chinensis]|uniref:Uncharacterized protein n=1 Tax=Coptis chinensis TaxID=261450 RepID=A0A835LUN8_9MAGN|nr:hypothetical protein IFM89_039338 [Coptis chinensis]
MAERGEEFENSILRIPNFRSKKQDGKKQERDQMLVEKSGIVITLYGNKYDVETQKLPSQSVMKYLVHFGQYSISVTISQNSEDLKSWIDSIGDQPEVTPIGIGVNLVGGNNKKTIVVVLSHKNRVLISPISDGVIPNVISNFLNNSNSNSCFPKLHLISCLCKGLNSLVNNVHNLENYIGKAEGSYSVWKVLEAVSNQVIKVEGASFEGLDSANFEWLNSTNVLDYSVAVFGLRTRNQDVEECGAEYWSNVRVLLMKINSYVLNVLANNMPTLPDASTEKFQALVLVESSISILGEKWLIDQRKLPGGEDPLPADRCLLLVLESSRVEVAVLLNEIAYLKYEASSESSADIRLKQQNLAIAFSLIEKIIKLISNVAGDEDFITDPSFIMMASSICTLIFDSTSEEALLSHPDFKPSTLNSLARLIAKSLRTSGQDQMSDDAKTEGDLHQIITAGYTRWADRFPRIKEAARDKNQWLQDLILTVDLLGNHT